MIRGTPEKEDVRKGEKTQRRLKRVKVKGICIKILMKLLKEKQWSGIRKSCFVFVPYSVQTEMTNMMNDVVYLWQEMLGGKVENQATEERKVDIRHNLSIAESVMVDSLLDHRLIDLSAVCYDHFLSRYQVHHYCRFKTSITVNPMDKYQETERRGNLMKEKRCKK